MAWKEQVGLYAMCFAELIMHVVCSCSYKRSASLSQFVMHRGLIISTMQVCVCVCLCMCVSVSVCVCMSPCMCNTQHTKYICTYTHNTHIYLCTHLQAIFSCVNHITADSLYPGILMIG